MQEEIAQRIAAFRGCLTAHGAQQTLSDHILRHDVAIVGVALEQQVRKATANRYGVDVQNIYLVGSGKLGFSPKPGQYFKHFSDGSDLDLAIVSPDLYVKVWRDVNDMYNAGEHFDVDAFNHYHRQGWIRPDKLPSRAEFVMCREWWEFFRELSGQETVRMKVSAGLYYNESFLRSYQGRALGVLQQKIIEGQA